MVVTLEMPTWKHIHKKVCVHAGPEFGPLEGHLLVIKKALCGLCTSGARFHAKFADALRVLDFTPTYADPNIWTHDAGDCHECVVVYVDDALTALKDPDSFHKELQSDLWNHKLKNIEEPKHHLDSDFFRDEHRTLCHSAQTYMRSLVDMHKELFGEQPKEVHFLLDKNDKPELDDTPLLGPDGIKCFQTLFGAAQWLITLSRFDIAHAIMSLGCFHAMPGEGHLE